MIAVIKSPDLRADNDDDIGEAATPIAAKEEATSRCSSKVWRRCIRLPVVLLAFCLTAYVCVLSSERYFNFWVQTSIERTDMHISEIAFPAISICPLKVISVNGTTDSEETHFVKLFNIAQDILWKTADAAKVTKQHLDEFADLDGHFLQDFYGFLNYTCEDLFMDCTWRRQAIPCCSIFSRLSTVDGSCFAFNSVLVASPIATWPWSVAGTGLYSALNVKIRRELKGHDKKVDNVGIIIHEHDQYLGSSMLYSTVERIVVPIEPLRFTADENVRARPVEMRRCYFTQELGEIGQSRSECIRNCHFRYISKQCNCSYDFPVAPTVRPLQRIKEDRRICTVRDLSCFQQHRLSIFSMSNIIEESSDNVISTIDCGCFPNCDNTFYRTDTYTESHLSGSDDNDAYIELDVHFSDEHLFSYRTSLRFTFLDLIVSFGGIAALFMGISVIGAIDYLLNRFPCCRQHRPTST